MMATVMEKSECKRKTTNDVVSYLVLSVDITVCRHQLVHHKIVTIARREVEGRPSSFCLDIHLCNV